MASRFARPLSTAERQALDAIEAGFVRERRLRRRRWHLALVAVAMGVLAAIAVVAPVAALTLGAAAAVAFAGPLMMTLFWRSFQTND